MLLMEVGANNMRPNWITPPKIEKRDPTKPLIEQVDEMYWKPHDMCVRHCFVLSGWHVSFAGELFDYTISPDFAGYMSNIYDESIYPKFIGKISGNQNGQWDENSPELNLPLAHLKIQAYIGIGDQNFDVVGNGFISVQVIRLRPKPISGFGNLSDPNELKAYVLSRINGARSEIKKDVFSSSEEGIKEEYFNNSSWVHSQGGGSRTHLVHNLFTALDDQHLLSVHYDPSFWSQDRKECSQKAYEISLTPLWDFMENLTIEDINENEGKTYLTGKVEETDETSAW